MLLLDSVENWGALTTLKLLLWHENLGEDPGRQVGQSVGMFKIQKYKKADYIGSAPIAGDPIGLFIHDDEHVRIERRAMHWVHMRVTGLKMAWVISLVMEKSWSL